MTDISTYLLWLVSDKVNNKTAKRVTFTRKQTLFDAFQINYNFEHFCFIIRAVLFWQSYLKMVILYKKYKKTARFWLIFIQSSNIIFLMDISFTPEFN